MAQAARLLRLLQRALAPEAPRAAGIPGGLRRRQQPPTPPQCPARHRHPHGIVHHPLRTAASVCLLPPYRALAPP